MAPDNHQRGWGVGTGNVPGNPLRSYRMSMLSHSFVEDEANGEWKPDESQPMNYAVLRINRAPILVTLVVGIMLIGFVVAAWLIG